LSKLSKYAVQEPKELESVVISPIALLGVLLALKGWILHLELGHALHLDTLLVFTPKPNCP
jgi:hypothetical protein